jgi:23S rRNA (uracil1939-C5)-methyltransferase
MVVLIHRTKQLPLQDELVEALKAEFPLIKAILLNVNSGDDNVILGKKTHQLTKDSTITDTLGDFTFQISATSFYQVNPVQAKKLYDTAIDFAKIKNTETVLDLYCGIGTIALFASKKAKQVYGVEINAQSIEDAKINAELNNITNIDFVAADAAVAAKTFMDNAIQMDVIVVDPPRKGLDQATIDSILALEPSRLVYVSCDPSTLVRDCVLLQDKYTVKKIQPVDMFPQTFHVETVVLLEKNKA